jgi:glycine cleavage system aminomethyltransferase T
VTGFEFLEVSGDAVARSPMERQAAAAGARFELRDGWNVAVSYPTNGSLTWADLSHLRKVEVHGRHELVLGQASRVNGGWWCPVTRDRTLVIGDADAEGLDVTCSFAALSIAGPAVREVFARFCAIDLREREMPIGAFRPGSIARTPGYVLREDEDRFLMLFGWALGEYMWGVVADAATSLGGAPAPAQEVAAHA